VILDNCSDICFDKAALLAQFLIFVVAKYLYNLREIIRISNSTNAAAVF
jgi:hypothetical protein